LPGRLLDFADLGYPDAAERQAKLRLAYALNQVLEDRKLSQAEAARLLGVTQPKMSALRNYKLTGFSVERLMNLLTALDQDIETVSGGSLARGRLVASASSRLEEALNAATEMSSSIYTGLVVAIVAAHVLTGCSRPSTATVIASPKTTAGNLAQGRAPAAISEVSIHSMLALRWG
jgi:predicted XRE-type DNA-binding protein